MRLKHCPAWNPELRPWALTPKRSAAPCPNCKGTGNETRAAGGDIIGCWRGPCSTCGGAGKIVVPVGSGEPDATGCYHDRVHRDVGRGRATRCEGLEQAKASEADLRGRLGRVVASADRRLTTLSLCSSDIHGAARADELRSWLTDITRELER